MRRPSFIFHLHSTSPFLPLSKLELNWGREKRKREREKVQWGEILVNLALLFTTHLPLKYDLFFFSKTSKVPGHLHLLLKNVEYKLLKRKRNLFEMSRNTKRLTNEELDINFSLKRQKPRNNHDHYIYIFL